MKINVNLPDAQDVTLTPRQSKDRCFLAEDIKLAVQAVMRVYPDWTSLVIIIAKGDGP